jgi:hypothetical protein
MDLTMTTDRRGRVVWVSALGLESTAPRVAIDMLADGCGPALRLRWSLDALAAADARDPPIAPAGAVGASLKSGVNMPNRQCIEEEFARLLKI